MHLPVGIPAKLRVYIDMFRSENSPGALFDGLFPDPVDPK